jgi:hypothetical protein
LVGRQVDPAGWLPLKRKKQEMKTLPASDSALRSKPSVREAITRAETAAADAVATKRQARLCKSRFKTARKNHRRAKKAARKADKRNKEAQAFLESVLTKANAQESSIAVRPSKQQEAAAKPRVGRVKAAKSKAPRKETSAPVRTSRSGRQSRPVRKAVADAAAFRMGSGAVAATEPTGLSTISGPIVAGDGD